MALGNALWFFGILAEAMVVYLLARRGAWKGIPVFTFYCVWDLLNNSIVFPVFSRYRGGYLSIYLLITAVDAIFIFAVLTEISWSVLRPIQALISRKVLVSIGLFFLLITCAAWPFTKIDATVPMTIRLNLILHIQQTSSLLRILFLLILASSSSLLSLGWRDRELQVATGLGFYSIVSFGAMLAHIHKANVLQYSNLNELVVASYLCSLLYWVYSFAQKEAERREFTPQMQNFLLAVAGVAREQRLALAQAAVERSRSKS